MSLAEHYDNLYRVATQDIASDNYLVDHQIDYPGDKRLGLTLLVRPEDHVKKKIHSFLNQVRAVEPDQYYYPDSDIHVTVMSNISCYAGFDLSSISIQEYIALVKKSIGSSEAIKIRFQGITASPSCIIVQGFPENDNLHKIRDHLRDNFRNSSLEHSIDKRYVIQTAHSTVARFRKKLVAKEKLLRTLEAYRDFYFGTSTINTMELVSNDWYQRKEQVKKIHEFKLRT